MTQPRQSDSYVVWVAGSHHHWYSMVLGVFTDRAAAVAYAQKQTGGGDPGDTVFVDGLIANEPDMLPEKVWTSRNVTLLSKSAAI